MGLKSPQASLQSQPLQQGKQPQQGYPQQEQNPQLQQFQQMQQQAAQVSQQAYLREQQAQLEIEQIQAQVMELQNNGIYRLNQLKKQEELKDILVEFGEKLFEKLDLIAIGLQGFANIQNTSSNTDADVSAIAAAINSEELEEETDE